MKRFFLILSLLLAGTAFLLSDSSSLSASSETIGETNVQESTPEGEVQASFIGTDNYSQLFGQEHYYTVVLRGNGEASAHAKFIFTNTEEATTSAVILKTPDVEVKDIVAYQIIREPTCRRYEPIKYEPYNPTITPTPYVPPKCIEYNQSNYFDQYFYGKTSYKKAQVKIEGDTIYITLPQGVAPETSASFIMYYHTNGYTTKNVDGSYAYEIRTLKSESPIRLVQVGVTTDSDLKLKDPKSKVEYTTSKAGGSMESIARTGSLNMGYAPSNQLNNYYRDIGRGSLVKTGYDLQPYDSFKVTGAYADATYKLYAKEILIGITIIVVIITVLIFVIRKMYKRYSLHKNMSESSSSNIPVPQPHHTAMNVLLMIVVSFISAMLFSGYIILLVAFFGNSGAYYYDSPSLLIMVVLFIVTLIVFGSVLCAPAIFLGFKRGIWWGIGTFFSTLVWIFVFIMIFVFLVALGRSNYYYPQTPVLYETPAYNGRTR